MGWRLLIPLPVALCLILAVPAEAGMQVHFDANVYNVLPGDTFQVQILLDANDSTPGNQPHPAGLFSMGFMVLFDANMAEVTDANWIVLPADLDNDGLGGSAFRTIGDGQAGAAGALDLSATQGYDGTLLATITIKDKAPETYTLSLGMYFATKANFLDFQGTEFDSDITFGSAIVNVIPEPMCLVILATGGVAMLRHRCRRANGLAA